MAFGILILAFLLFAGRSTVNYVFASDLEEVKKAGVLRHLGVPYANFVTGSGDGLDVDMVKLFAKHLGVQYEYVRTNWQHVIPDLTGKLVKPAADQVEITGQTSVRGDIIANGLTVLSWREKVVDYSFPTFPTQIWLVARAESPLTPISPSGNVDKDIATTKTLLKGRSVLGVVDTCYDPSLYGLKEAGAEIRLFTGSLNELVPALLKGETETLLQEVPDCLMALRKWPGKLKVLGPLYPMQHMAYAFRKTSPRLREAFNRFFEDCRRDGTYLNLVKKYYPAVFTYYPDFFQ